MGKKWYTDNVKQVLAESCPEGYHPGRLPVSEETKAKHKKNNAWTSMTEEQKAERAKKISNTIKNRSDEEKKEYSKKVSEGRKGKGLGIEPWNKGKTGLQEAWNKNLHMTEESKEHLRQLYNNLPDEEKERRKQAISKAHKNKKPWNYGLSYTLDPETVKQAKAKEIATKKIKNVFIKSSLEDYVYNELCLIFPEQYIIRQYFDENRYPFACDFYIKPLDLFLEINGNWTHGYMPFDPADDFCKEQLTAWKEKAKVSDYYKNAIYTWTDLDVRKNNIAKENNLLYFALYSKEEIKLFLEELRGSLNAL